VYKMPNGRMAWDISTMTNHKSRKFSTIGFRHISQIL
jgi:hypothetical protein